MRAWTIAALVLMLTGIMSAAEDDAATAVRAWVKANVKGEGGPPESVQRGLANMTEMPAEVQRPFGRWRFFLMRFMQWPVAMQPPEPLASVNVFAVSEPNKDGKRTVALIKPGDGSLWGFCGKELRAAGEPAARAAAYACCLLRAELSQDGFFKWEIDVGKFVVTRKEETTRVEAHIGVAPGGGNSGSIDLVLAFAGKEGVFQFISEKEELKAGMRPICQSLRLTDPDDTVRNSARLDILVMGKNALPYLRMQVTRTEGELRRRIRELADLIEVAPDGPLVEGGQPPID